MNANQKQDETYQFWVKLVLALVPFAYWGFYLSMEEIYNRPNMPFFLEPAKWYIVGGLASVFLNGPTTGSELIAGAGIMLYLGAYFYYRWIILFCKAIYSYLPHLAAALASRNTGWEAFRFVIAMILSGAAAFLAVKIAARAGGWHKRPAEAVLGRPASEYAASQEGQNVQASKKAPEPAAPNYQIPGVDIYMNPRPNPAALDKVIGLEKAKQIAVNAIKMAMDSRIYKEYGLTPPGGMLLYGPPGTGKTSFARVCAEALGCAFYVVNASSLTASLVGQSEQAVRNLFAHARAHRPAIIFWDEIDAVGQRRDGMNLNRPSDLILNILLAEMDGFNAKGEKGVLVIGATNRIDVLDEALLRPGRFDFKVEVGLPGFEDRVKLLEFFLKGRKVEGITREGLKEIAEHTEGWSPADLKALVDEAAWRALERNEPITVGTLRVALQEAAGEGGKGNA
ncbi:ATP-binding protein [Moorella naiadis]|uniref:ATP-binding protein n=1 Tax=Moorella naiadis (nom. illeg.) TaxID=3093670 RepID=UPI003D9C8733